MSDEVSTSFKVLKRVAATVEVDITVADVLAQASVEALRQECIRRNIPLKTPKTGGPKHKIEAQDMQTMLGAFHRRDWREFLWTLEWALPRDFRGLSDFMGARLK